MSYTLPDQDHYRHIQTVSCVVVLPPGTTVSGIPIFYLGNGTAFSDIYLPLSWQSAHNGYGYYISNLATNAFGAPRRDDVHTATLAIRL